MGKIANSILDDIGLSCWPPFLKDRLFTAALLAAFPVWALIWIKAAPTFSVANRSVILVIFITVIWHPILEEILFRGVIQGSLIKKPFGQKTIIGFTIANWSTSLLFAIAHLWYQPVAWALLVFFPSLIYGFFRDRYSSIYPCITLHAVYNGGFTAVNILAQLY